MRFQENFDVLFGQVWHFNVLQEEFLQLSPWNSLDLASSWLCVLHKEHVKQQVYIIKPRICKLVNYLRNHALLDLPWLCNWLGAVQSIQMKLLFIMKFYADLNLPGFFIPFIMKMKPLVKKALFKYLGQWNSDTSNKVLEIWLSNVNWFVHKVDFQELFAHVVEEFRICCNLKLLAMLKVGIVACHTMRNYIFESVEVIREEGLHRLALSSVLYCIVLQIECLLDNDLDEFALVRSFLKNGRISQG